MKTETKIVGKKKLTVEYGLSTTNHTYFSVTVNIYERNKDRWEDIGGGADHEAVLKYFPHLKPLVELHLSDVSGLPMYAYENGYYHWRQGKNEWVKSLLRMTDEEYKAFDTKLNEADYKDRPTLFMAYVVENKQRWKDEADKAIKDFNLLS